MMNFAFIWNQYVNNPGKKELIEKYKSAKNGTDFAELFALANKHLSIGEEPMKQTAIGFNNGWTYCVSEFANIIIEDEAKAAYVFEDIISQDIVGGRIENDEKAVRQNYRDVLARGIITSISANLYKAWPEYFLPFFYDYGMYYLRNIADEFEIALPKQPAQKEYKQRLMYYTALCHCLHDFRRKHNLNPAEICVFLYDFVPAYVNSKEQEPLPEEAEQAWFIGANPGFISDDDTEIVWGIKSDVRRGDIVVCYELAPTKSIVSVWRAMGDGSTTPFEFYNSYAQMGQRVDIPHITLDELRQDSYFKDNSFVRRNFQGMSKCPMEASDYTRIVEILRHKGFEGALPKLFVPGHDINVEIGNEQDVSDKLLVPMLEEMGWKRDKDFKPEVRLRAGRGLTGYAMDKHVDFLLHYKQGKDKTTAKVAIEVKEHMKSVAEIDECFVQGESYAKLAEA